MTFNFETIQQAHDSAIRCMTWSRSDQFLVSADDHGYVKYWQQSLSNLKVFVAHKECVRDLSFAPTDSKFVTASDDGTLKLWDFATATEERSLTGHGWDVKCADWHPYRGLIVSGSKDNLVKMWDPRTGKALSTLHGHKNTIGQVKWNRNGLWLVTASRDGLLRLFDVRTMREVQSFKGHKKEANSVAWHPVHETLFTSGGANGEMMFWQVGADIPEGTVEYAHESNIWSVDYHPLGHLLTTASNDHTTRFWTRNRPGETLHDRYSVGRDDWKRLRDGLQQVALYMAGGGEEGEVGKAVAAMMGGAGMSGMAMGGLGDGGDDDDDDALPETVGTLAMDVVVVYLLVVVLWVHPELSAAGGAGHEVAAGRQSGTALRVAPEVGVRAPGETHIAVQWREGGIVRAQETETATEGRRIEVRAEVGYLEVVDLAQAALRYRLLYLLEQERQQAPLVAVLA
ncbi:hypothetical protein HDU93_001964 [Gonapodya sp. JEL0774]|nr:hypothetical protein HDU93_001964 [Gonapodya sp. JEL0774]